MTADGGLIRKSLPFRHHLPGVMVSLKLPPAEANPSELPILIRFHCSLGRTGITVLS